VTSKDSGKEPSSDGAVNGADEMRYQENYFSVLSPPEAPLTAGADTEAIDDQDENRIQTVLPKRHEVRKTSGNTPLPVSNSSPAAQPLWTIISRRRLTAVHAEPLQWLRLEVRYPYYPVGTMIDLGPASLKQGGRNEMDLIEPMRLRLQMVTYQDPLA